MIKKVLFVFLICLLLPVCLVFGEEIETAVSEDDIIIIEDADSSEETVEQLSADDVSVPVSEESEIEELEIIMVPGNSTETAEFDYAYGRIVSETDFFADEEKQVIIGCIFSGVVKIEEETEDLVAVSFRYGDELLKGYVNKGNLSAATESEYIDSSNTCEFDWADSKSNVVEEKPLNIVFDYGDAVEKADSFADDLTADETGLLNEDESNEPIEVYTERTNDGNEPQVSENAKANKAEGILTEETEAETLEIVEADVAGEQASPEEIELVARTPVVPTDYELVADTEVTMTIAAGVGKQAFGHYKMENCGLLTILFKAVDGKASGNVNITIKDSEDHVVFSEYWSTSLGSVSFSDFVEADDYTVIIDKSGKEDANSYVLTAKTMETRTGEIGHLNNTQNNATEVAVGSTPNIGIRSCQDLILGRNDFYIFSLSSPGWTTISFTNRALDALSFEVYGDDTSTGNFLYNYSKVVAACTDVNETDAQSFSHSGWLDAGVYYIIVKSVNGSWVANQRVDTGRYDIQVLSNPISITEKEINDSFTLAYSNENLLNVNKTKQTGLISESNTIDCFHFYLASQQTLNIRLYIQFKSVVAQVCKRDGTVVADFSQNGTSGSLGNPYELELKGGVFTEGHYYLKVQKPNADDSYGPYEVSAERLLAAYDVLTYLDGNNLRMDALYGTPENIAPGSVVKYFSLYLGNKEIYNLSTMEDSVTTTISENGNYSIHLVITDGTNWNDVWKPFYVNSFLPLSFKEMQVSVADDGTVTAMVTQSGGIPVESGQFRFYKGNTLVGDPIYTTTELTATKKLEPGVYSIQYCGYNGSWADIWQSVTVGSLKVTSLFGEFAGLTETSGMITIYSETTPNDSLTEGYYVIYRDGKLLQTISSTASQIKLKISKSGEYVVHFAISDGTFWADQWCAITVNLTSPFTVSNLILTPSTKQLTCEAVTNDERNISSTFILYDANSKVIETKVVNGRTCTFTNLNDGYYAVQYAGTDGISWAGMWNEAVVGEVLSVKSLTASRTDGFVDVNAVLSNNNVLRQVIITLYNDNTAITTYTWNGSGEYLSHRFNVGTQIVNSVHYVIYDGAEWKDKWAPIGGSLVIESLSAVRNGTQLTVTADVYHTDTLAEEMVVLYNGSTQIHSKSYTGSQVTQSHKYNVGSNTVTSVHYAVFDGNTWVDKWTEVTSK